MKFAGHAKHWRNEKEILAGRCQIKRTIGSIDGRIPLTLYRHIGLKV
jgi:hypothetical protein